jgi:hypothetical protein
MTAHQRQQRTATKEALQMNSVAHHVVQLQLYAYRGSAGLRSHTAPIKTPDSQNPLLHPLLHAWQQYAILPGRHHMNMHISVGAGLQAVGMLQQGHDS